MDGLKFPMVGAGLWNGYWIVGEMVVRRLWLSGGWLRPCRGWEIVVWCLN